MKLGDDDWNELGKQLGPLGWGIWYVWNAVAPEEYGGVELSGWCVAREGTDLIFMRTNGYTAGYLNTHSAPGGKHFWPAGYSIKSRESDWTFMVLERDCMRGNSNERCSTDEMIEYARRWDGYYLEGEEYEYYWALIKAAEEEMHPGAIPLEER